MPKNKLSKQYILLLLAFAQFTNIVDSMIMMPLGDYFILDFNITSQQYSFLVSAYALSATVASFVGMLYMDFFDRRKALLFIYFGFSISTILCGFAYSYEALLLYRFIAGLFGGVLGALILAIVSDIFPFKERGTAMGYLMAAFSAASALGVPLGLYLAAKLNWHVPIYGLGFIALLLFIIFFLVFPSMKEHLETLDKKRSILTTVNLIVKDNNQIIALLSGFVLVLGHFIIIPFIAPFMSRNIGFSPEQISLLFLFGGLATIISSPLIGKLTDKYGVMPIFTIVLGLSFIPTLAITNLSTNSIPIALCFTTLFFVLGSGRMISPNTLITAAAGVENRGSFMSVKSALQQFGVALSSLISGAIVFINDDGLFENYDIVGYISVIIVSLTWFITRKIKVAKGN